MVAKHVMRVEIFHEGIIGTTGARTVVSVRSADGERQMIASAVPGHLPMDSMMMLMASAFDPAYPGRPF